MKINAISQNKINTTLKNKTNNSYKLKQLQADTISFQKKGKYEKPSPNNPQRRMAALLAAAGLPFFVDNTTSSNILVMSAYADEIQEPQNTNAIYDLNDANILQAHNNFQLKQTKDSPSITFDFTGNYGDFEYESIASSVILTKNPKEIDEAKSLDDVITNFYEIDENDIQIRQTIAQAILKANPWMSEAVKKGVIDYTQGDITNIDPNLILSTDYTIDGGGRIHLPDVKVTIERHNDFDTAIKISTEFLPANANENGESTITLNKNDFSKWSNANNDNVLGQKLAKAYGLSTFNSYAGDAIWHGIALDEANYEIFKNASEEDTKAALYNYLYENETAELTLPRIGVTVMESEYQEVSKDILTKEKQLDVSISYMTADRAVYDLGTAKTFRPIDILDTILFTDGTTLKEAYEENNDKYASLALAAWQQQVDNNNALLEYYGVEIIDEEDLYSEISLEDLGVEDSQDYKINIQPVAIAHVKCKKTCDSPKAPKEETPEETTAPTTKPSEPSEPSEPTKPSEPSEPTEPSKPSEPTEPSEPSEPTEPSEPEDTCPTEPEVSKPDEELDVPRPTRPSEPSQPTKPSEPSEPTEPSKPSEPTYCPTEPSQPDSGYDDNDVVDDELDFEETTPTTKPSEPTEPSKPSEPIATEPSKPSEPTEPSKPSEPTYCPTEPSQPNAGYDDNDVVDDELDFASNSSSNQTSTDKIINTPSSGQNTTPAQNVTQTPIIEHSSNGVELRDDELTFE